MGTESEWRMIWLEKWSIFLICISLRNLQRRRIFWYTIAFWNLTTDTTFNTRDPSPINGLIESEFYFAYLRQRDLIYEQNASFQLFAVKINSSPSLCLVVMFLPSDQEVTSLIPDSVVRFFSAGELFHGMYELCVLCFSVICSMPHSQRLSNNPYPEPKQPNSSYWYLRSILILCSLPRLGLPKGLFPVGLPFKILKIRKLLLLLLLLLLHRLVYLGVSVSDYWPWGRGFDSRHFHNFKCG